MRTIKSVITMVLFSSLLSEAAFSQCVDAALIEYNMVVRGNLEPSGNFDRLDRIGLRGVVDLFNCEENENFFWIRVSVYPSEDTNQAPLYTNYVITSILDADMKIFEYNLSSTTTLSCPAAVYVDVEVGYVFSEHEDDPEQDVGIQSQQLDWEGFFNFNWIV